MGNVERAARFSNRCLLWGPLEYLKITAGVHLVKTGDVNRQTNKNIPENSIQTSFKPCNTINKPLKKLKHFHCIPPQKEASKTIP